MRVSQDYPPKICPCCKKYFYKSSYNSKRQWEDRIYCCFDCKRQKLPIEEYIQKRLNFILSRTITTKSGCIEWQGCTNSSGYGIIGFLGKEEYVHRIVYRLIIEEIPKGLHVLHKCDNPKCVNIDHLFLGTHQDNMDDMVSKRRHITKLKGINDINEIVQLAKDGIAYKYIAKEFGIDRTYANFIGIQNGIRRIPIRM